jgi:hypothetical protein
LGRRILVRRINALRASGGLRRSGCDLRQSHSLTLGCREHVGHAGGAFCAQNVTTVGAVLDFAHDAHPILLKRIVALDDSLQFESSSSIADLFATEHVEASVDVFLNYLGRDLLDPHEELLVERAKALDSRLQFIDGNVELGGVHGLLT